MSSIKSWVLAIRPKTLTAAIVPIAVGTALPVLHGKAPLPWVSWFALLASFFIQIGTNFVNDAKDFEKGADTEKRIGPQRVTQSGLFTSRQVMWAAGLVFLLSILCGLPLVFRGGFPIFLIGLLSVTMGYAYTAGPFPLAYRGLGDLFVIVFFGLIAVSGLYYLQVLEFSWDAIWAGLQVGFHSTVLIAINNYRDMVGDSEVGKRTLAVRFGQKFAKVEIVSLSVLPYIMNLYWFFQQKMGPVILPILAMPLTLHVILGVWKSEPGPVLNQFLAKASLQHLLFGGLFALGLCL